MVTVESSPTQGCLGMNGAVKLLASLWQQKPERSAGEPNSRRRWMKQCILDGEWNEACRNAKSRRVCAVTDRVVAYEEED
ncbi:hypothetical protein KO02_08325 [Sphingobacterium sp. ML3W]|nr:hypothetical protein KO02_08325 [Sphingobacterium sp. ML3W]